MLNTGDYGTQSGFSKSPPLACWYLPREDEGRPNAGGHSAEGPTPQIPRGGGDVGVSTLALEFAGGRLDRHTKVTLSSAAPAASSAPSSASARGLDWFTFFLADVSGRDGHSRVARGRELRARAGDRRDQPRPRRPCRPRGAPWPERPFCLHRQRRGRRRHGRMWILGLEPGGVLPHRDTGST